MAINKIIINNEVKLDLTPDTVTPADVKKGKIFHGADGEIVEGNLNELVYTDKKWDFYDETGTASLRFTNPEDGWRRKGTYGWDSPKITSENLQPYNIKSGTKILGVTGTYDQIHDFIKGIDEIRGDWEDVNKIPDNFAYGSYNLKTVQFDNIEIVGNGAFSWCPLENAIFPNCTTVGMEAFIKDSYSNIPHLTGEVHFPKLITADTGAFKWTDMPRLYFPELVFAGNATFADWTGTIINSDDLPKLKNIMSDTFARCRNVTSISLPSLETAQFDAFCCCTNLENIDLPNLKEISPVSFDGCDNLKTVNMPNLEKLPPYLFVGCWQIEEINLPKAQAYSESFSQMDYEIQYFGLRYGESFYDKLPGQTPTTHPCKLKRLYIPSFNGIIGGTFGQAMMAYNSLEELDIRNVPEIKDWTFDGYSKLKTVNIDNVQKLGVGAFGMCHALTEISIPNATVISNGAFYNCNTLEKITIGNADSLANPCPNCSQLKQLILTKPSVIPNTQPYSWGPEDMGHSQDFLIYVPDNLVSAYQTADNWSYYAHLIKPLSELQEA